MNEFLSNKIFFITLSVWFLAQTFKVIIGVIREKRFNFKWFVGTGGMPSSHVAGAAALATSCGLETGFNAPVFAIAAVFALVIMFDAQGVRHSAGQQAVILNQILDDMYQGKFEGNKLKELLGHTPMQVFAGAIFGIAVALFLYNL
jgi:acid phosphatase family membrane protein YuiD